MDHPAQDTGSGELVRRAAVGEGAAWAELTHRYTRLLWSIARGHGLGAADADDAVQATWVRLLENLDGLREPDRVGAWLATTARRECLRILRRSGRERPTGDERFPDVADSAPALDTALLREERDVVLWSAFSGLSERCQGLLRLLFSEPPIAYSEVSQILDMPVGAIGPTRQRCLIRLRERITAEGPDAVALLRDRADPAVAGSAAASSRMATEPEVDPL
jgi:RNA polymerase sigma factor (sigma-70 family)